MNHIYELVETSDEERYYPLGVFLEERDAMEELNTDYPPYCDDNPESVTIQVRRRKIGFHPHEYVEHAERTWVRNYESEKPEWITKPIKIFSPNKTDQQRDER